MPNPLLPPQDDPRYSYDAPTNPLAPQPTMADAASWHAQNLADTWTAMQNPQTWTDAARQYGNALLMGTTAPAAKMPVLYHGTNEGVLSMHGPEMALTPDRTQAAGYANNYHRVDEHGDVPDEPSQPVVHEVQATPGPTLDVSADIRRYESGKAGDNADAFIANLAQDARKNGYRYLQFDHPNMPLPGADPNGSHQVVVSLHPNEDLGYSLRVMEHEEAKLRRLTGSK
jgi:hypothetical protein